VFSHSRLCVFILMISHIWSLQLTSKNNISLLPFLIIKIFYFYLMLITLNKINLQPLFTLNPQPTFIIIFMQGFPETWKLFQGFLQGKKVEKGWVMPEERRWFIAYLRTLYQLRGVKKTKRWLYTMNRNVAERKWSQHSMRYYFDI
jgi:hypothetical protein